MFGRVPINAAAFVGTRPNIRESHSEISTRVPFCSAHARPPEDVDTIRGETKRNPAFDFAVQDWQRDPALPRQCAVHHCHESRSESRQKHTATHTARLAFGCWHESDPIQIPLTPRELDPKATILTCLAWRAQDLRRAHQRPEGATPSNDLMYGSIA